MAKSAFFSFHYDRDAWRVQQIINMGKLEGQPLMSAQKWEAVKRRGDQAIKNWIEEQMKLKSAVVVLVGAQTAQRRWVKHEIAYAWDNRKPLVGIRIHGLADRNGYTDTQGSDPFKMVNLRGGATVADFVTLQNPVGSTGRQVYASISSNLLSWVNNGYKRS